MTDPVFGKYQVFRRIAVGGMGEIFLARQIAVAGFERLVILKSMLPDLAKEPAAVTEFLDEARIAATLNHPNIVIIHEVGAWGGSYYIAMEHIPGANLADLFRASFKQKTKVPPGVCARIVHDAASALAHAHSARTPDGRSLGIVHRDVSPNNIMVRPDGLSKLVDFGIAKANNRVTRTKTGWVKGKLSYMSPEQVRGGVDLDHRSDQFSLGIVMWELLASRPLFRVIKNERQRASVILGNDAPDPRDANPDAPAALAEIAKRMLCREREDRYSNCEHVALALDRYLADAGPDASRFAVEAWVEQVAAEDVASSQEVSTAPDDFFISLAPGGSGPSQPPPPRRLARALLFAAAAIAVLALVLINRARAPTDAGPPTTVEPVKVATALRITSHPTGASVSHGAELLGTTPMTLDPVEPGRQLALHIQKDGFEPRQINVTLRPGELRQLDVALEAKRSEEPVLPPTPVPRPNKTPPPPAAPQPSAPAGPGFITVNTVPWTRVEIDDAPHGATPVFKIRVAAGTHRVRLINDIEGIDTVRSVEVRTNEVTKLDLQLK